MPALAAEGRGVAVPCKASVSPHVSLPAYAGTPDPRECVRARVKEPKGAQAVASDTNQGRVQISATLEPRTRSVAEGTNFTDRAQVHRLNGMALHASPDRCPPVLQAAGSPLVRRSSCHPS